MKTATRKPSVDDQLMADAAERAEQAFKDHVITQHMAQGMYRSWRCMKPGTWHYGFDVTTRPGWLFLTGDIGELIVTRECEMIAWARSAIRDPRYFASKVPHALPTKEWSYDKAIEWIDEGVADAEKEQAEDEDYDGREKCESCGRMVLVLEDGTFETHHKYPNLGLVGGNCSNGGEPATLAVRFQYLKNAARTEGLNGHMDEHEFCTALYESNLIDGCDWPSLKVFNSNFLWCYQAVKWFLAHLPEEVAPTFEQAESGNA